MKGTNQDVWIQVRKFQDRQRSERHHTTKGDEGVPDTTKWISTPVPAPKRSTLGVVAALDSVVGLCSGIESYISKNKDTQLDVHSDFRSSAFEMMSSVERCGRAERADWLLIVRVCSAN